MFKQLFLSAALTTAFAATPVLADDHEKMNKDDPEWEQKVNKTKHDMDKNHGDKDHKNKDHKDKNRQGDTTSYDEMDRDGEVVPDKEAYETNGEGNQQHPAHVDEEATPYEGQ